VRKASKVKKASINGNIYEIFSELIKKLGNRYSAQFLYDRAEQIVNLHLKNHSLTDDFGKPNNHSSNYYCKDVHCVVENNPWLPLYNENLDDVDCSYNHNQFLRELGVR
tara:strand:- start:533 stop:859 length:327 start_codon:yes stop_codon:yes gene_type:complete